MAKHTRIPAPPNDGKTYKFAKGKYVPAGRAQKTAEPASERRAKAEATKAAKKKANKKKATKKKATKKKAAKKEAAKTEAVKAETKTATDSER